MKNFLRFVNPMNRIPILFAVVGMLFIGSTQMFSQLANVTCTPSYQYGCMSFNQFNINSSATPYTGTTCGTSYTGNGTNSNVTFNALPGQTLNWQSTSLGNYQYGGQYDGYMNIYVDWNNDGDFLDANEWVTQWWYAYISANGSFVVPSTVSAGPKRMRIMFDYWYYADYYTGYYNNPCFSTSNGYSNYGDFRDFTINIGFNNDAAVQSLSTSTAAPFAPGNNTIQAIIKNNGLNTINSMDINYTITTSSGSTTSGTITYSTPLAGQATATVPILTYNFPAVGAVTAQVTVSTVNGGTDGNPTNNSGSGLFGAGLNGTYTVGGSSPNFANIKEACDQLTAGGTIGAVTFNIRTGTYTEAANIANIPGNTSTKPIVFQSEDGNKNTCVLQFSGLTTPTANTGSCCTTT
ncbi:MAG: GEVED domain-containing protein [Candidatus Kapaibacterium sp.]